mgnify:FL=1
MIAATDIYWEADERGNLHATVQGPERPYRVATLIRTYTDGWPQAWSVRYHTGGSWRLVGEVISNTDRAKRTAIEQLMNAGRVTI